MSGEGQRFKDAGYSQHKPLIEIDGKPIIQHVVELFNPQVDSYTFICNENHISTIQQMHSLLLKLKLKAEIICIPSHKLGPVYAVMSAKECLTSSETIICYCDFGSVWNYKKFLQHSKDGSIACYRGFHPHMLGPDNYAYCNTDKNRTCLEIREKQPFTNNKMNEWASNGIYYFKSGDLVKKYFKALLNQNQGHSSNGEYYVSMVYNLMIQDGLEINVFPIQRMLQWGTPYDVECYQKWSSYFSDICKSFVKVDNPKNCVTILPMAGLGSRFSTKGYKIPKPLLDVNGHPMFFQAVDCLPKSESFKFVTLKEYVDKYLEIQTTIETLFTNSALINLNHLTEGQACSTMEAVRFVNPNYPILITACDNASHYDSLTYKALLQDETVDVIVWTFTNSPTSKYNPNMYSWVKVDEKGFVTSVHIKDCPFDDVKNQQTIIGTFFFRKASLYSEAYNQMISENNKTNGEFYIDNMLNNCIKLGMKVKTFLISHYVCWGIPDEYETYNYWRNHFHLSDNHPYLIFNDATLNNNQINYFTQEKFF
jgi:dTDP-glucose pyrophosphorylase